MTVWTGGLVIEDNVKRTDPDTGTFFGTSANGQIPVISHPASGWYDIVDFHQPTGGNIGGGVSVY